MSDTEQSNSSARIENHAAVSVSEYFSGLGQLLRTRRPYRVVFKPVDNRIVVDFQLHGPQGSGAEPSELTDEQFRAIHLALNERAAFWPDATDSLFSTNTKRKRILLAAPDEEAAMFDIIIEQPKGAKSASLVFDNVTTGGILPLLDRLVLESEVRDELTSFSRARTGIYFAVHGKKSNAVDAVNTLLAIRPDAVYLREPDPIQLEHLLTLSSSRVVVVGIPGDEAFDSALDFFNSLGTHPNLVREVLAASQFCYSQSWSRRVCANCSRQTSLSPQTFERIPLYLAPAEDQIYLFGRGCPLCGHASYRGIVNVDALLRFTPAIRDGLVGKLSLNRLAELCSSAGYRTPMEDGLTKIARGLTSYEEVAASTKAPSDSFAAVIQKRKHSRGLSESSQSPSKQDTAGEKPLPQTNFHTSSPRVLVVEDDPDQRAVLELVFKTEGYEVTVAENGNTALERLEQQSIDIIVSDLMMPERNGEELLRAVKNDPRFRTIPFLMLTAIDSREQEFRSLEQGADDYCAKTVKRKILLKRVERLLQRS